MKKLKGNIINYALDGHCDVLVHGCNCFCTMGAGLAKSIKHIFPKAFQADQNSNYQKVRGEFYQKDARKKLGSYSSSIEDNILGGQFTIVNAYTQYSFGRGKRHADYDAIRKVFKKIKKDFTGKRIAYPKIGAGLAGGSWAKISKIIDEELYGEDHTLIVL